MLDHPEYFYTRRARDEVMNKVSNAWKSLNHESIFDSHFYKAFTNASFNLARMVPLMYSYDENHSLLGLEGHVHSLLYDQVF
jgi:(3S)-linalool synthase